MAVKLYFLKDKNFGGKCEECEMLNELELDGNTYYVFECEYDVSNSNEDTFEECKECLEKIREKSIGEYIIY